MADAVADKRAAYQPGTDYARARKLLSVGRIGLGHRFRIYRRIVWLPAGVDSRLFNARAPR